MVWASAGDRAVVGRALRLLASIELDTTTGRNGAPLAVARAVNAIVNHDDDSAVEAITSFVADHPLSDRLTSVSLRRFLAVPYVCCAEARQCWDAQGIGPSHHLQRDVARALLAARAGEVAAGGTLPPPPAVYTALPMPWSIELAARVHANGNPAGRRLAQWLVDRHPAAARDELQRRVSSAEPTVARAAERLLGSIPFPPEHTTRVEVLGPLRLLVDGEPVERPEQRRARVRELLAVLVTSPTVGRDRVMDLLWPELAPADAARNLRVTLTHLRRLLEPERTRGDNAYHLRVEAEHLHLVASTRLTVDLWELRHHLETATSARGAGNADTQASHLAAAVGLWRGNPLGDLDRIPDLSIEVDQLRVQLLDATLTLGELRLSEGAPTATLECAERGLAADPYDERAFRLLIAAHLQRGDRAQVHLAVQRTLAALEELGVEPDHETAILLRRAGVRDPALV
jgi:LuxR family transcriptional regulator, maltose regulon positive regulatory protein